MRFLWTKVGFFDLNFYLKGTSALSLCVLCAAFDAHAASLPFFIFAPKAVIDSEPEKALAGSGGVRADYTQLLADWAKYPVLSKINIFSVANLYLRGLDYKILGRTDLPGNWVKAPTQADVDTFDNFLAVQMGSGRSISLGVAVELVLAPTTNDCDSITTTDSTTNNKNNEYITGIPDTVTNSGYFTSPAFDKLHAYDKNIVDMLVHEQKIGHPYTGNLYLIADQPYQKFFNLFRGSLKNGSSTNCLYSQLVANRELSHAGFGREEMLSELAQYVLVDIERGLAINNVTGISVQFIDEENPDVTNPAWSKGLVKWAQYFNGTFVPAQSIPSALISPIVAIEYSIPYWKPWGDFINNAVDSSGAAINMNAALQNLNIATGPLVVGSY